MRMARSELLSTFFPTWIWQGREWRKGKVPKYDPYYWIVAHAHPVVSSFYPPHILSSVIGVRLKIDSAFRLLLFSLLGHLLFGSIGWYVCVQIWSNPLVALFGALTLTYSAYNIKQQPCLVYTIAWFPWLLYGIAGGNVWITSLSFWMVILAGYYPLGIQVFLIGLGATFLWSQSLIFALSWITIGACIGAVQLIPFLRYLPKTIRAHKHDEIGKVPWWHFISLVFPFRKNVNGVGYWEMSYYVGIVPLVLLASSTSRVWPLAVVSVLLMLGVGARFLPRISARWAFTLSFSLGWMATSALVKLPEHVTLLLLLVQAFDLYIHNHDLTPTLPFAELRKSPQIEANRKLWAYLKAHLNDGSRVSGLPYPFFTGHIHEIRSLGYCGGMQLKLMAKWRNDQNPNGSGYHDYFMGKEDSDGLDIARTQFAFSRKKLDTWTKTSVKHLYANPRYSLRPQP